MKFVLLVSFSLLAVSLALPLEDLHHRKHTRKPRHPRTTPGHSAPPHEATTPTVQTSTPEEGQSTAAPVEPSSPSVITTAQPGEEQTTQVEVVTSLPEESSSVPDIEGRGNLDGLFHKKFDYRHGDRTRRPRPSASPSTLPQENTTPSGISTSAPEEPSTNPIESATEEASRRGFFGLW